MNFGKLIRPTSLAVVGASANPTKVGYALLNNVISGGYEGAVYAVNPRESQILGLSCYKSLLDIPGPVDCAVVIVKREAVVEVLNHCVEKGVGGVIVITAGFSETDDIGKQLQAEMVQIARQNKIALLGPNCLGLINPWIKLNASFGQKVGKPGPVALVSQSGALITAVQDWAEESQLGFSVVASVGNKAVIDEVDLLHYLRTDNNTKVIAAYLENITKGQEFMRVAEEVSRTKPLVILKAGRTQAGARAASSHTGSLAGADAAYACAFERTGIIRAESIEHLFDVATCLAYQPVPRGDRIAVVTNAGGPGIMMSDALEMAGLTMVRLSSVSEKDLALVLPSAASTHNPVDVLGDADGERYGSAIDILVKDESVDGLIVLLTPQKMTDAASTARVVVEASKKTTKPIFACFMGARTIADGVQIFRENGIPQYSIPERAAKAMMEMVRYERHRRRSVRVVERFAVNKNPVIKLIKSYRSKGLTEIGEIDAKAIMNAYGFVLPVGMPASTVEEAGRFADQIGYPIAMKISSPDILHKSDVGGVKVGLAKRSDVEDAFELMMLRVKRKMPTAEIRGVLLEKMVTEGREVILGMKKDAQFGPMLMFGLGGIFVEVLKDVTFGLAPVTEQESYSMIERTKTYKLLTGARGQRGVDIRSIAENLQLISQLALDFPHMEEIDINPLKVGPEGDGAFVVDARIILSKEKR